MKIDTKNLGAVILSYDNGIHTYFFYSQILENPNLSEEEKEIFKGLWKKAGDFELWKDRDLSSGYKFCVQFIRDNYDLNDRAIELIAGYIAYNWK